ncbi:TPA: hypothetical protein L3526_004247 [Escherichia coli]|nr:hypothetical protein [Escherichia coli]
MNTISSLLLSLETGHIQKVTDDFVGHTLVNLPNEQVKIDMNDSTAFMFCLNDKRFTLINTGSGSFVVRTC